MGSQPFTQLCSTLPILITVSILLTVGHGNSQAPIYFSQETAHKILQIISHSTRSHYSPVTLRPIFTNSSSSSFDHFDWELVSTTYPILLINTKLSPEVRKHFYTSTVLYWIVDPKSLEDTLGHLKAETANRRWDRVVLIGKEEFIRRIFNPTVLSGIRLKMALAIDSGDFWLEPVIFNREIMKLQTLEGHIPPPAMGTNLRGRHFKVGGCEFPPWTLKIRHPLTGGERVAGTHYEMVAFASRKFNFTFETNVLNGPDYGELHPDGTWTGMYSMIYYRDRGYEWVFMLGHDASWSAYVDYASTFGTIDLIFATSWPSAKLKWTAVFEPFQKSVWLAILVSFLIISFFMYIFMKIQVNHIAIFMKKKAKEMSVLKTLMMPYSILLEQGVDEPQGIKSLIGIWLVFTIIIGTGYKSTLKSRLTFPTPETLPSNYKELAAREDYGIILNAQGVVEKYFFATTTVPEMVNIRNRMTNEGSTERCVRAAFLDEHFACIGWYPYFKQTASATLTLYSGLEPLIYTKQAAHFNSLSMAFQKDSVFVDAFTPITAALYETGIYGTWEEAVNNYYKEIGRQKVIQAGKNDRIYVKLVELSKAGENVAKPLKNQNFSIVYFLILMGWVLGAGVLIVEALGSWWSSKRQDRLRVVLPVRTFE